MRVPADHLVVNADDDVGDIERAGLACEVRMKQDLQQEIAKLLREFKRASLLNGVEDFVRFLDQVGPQRQVGLLAVPRAAAGSSQARLDGDEVFKQFSYRLVCSG